MTDAPLDLDALEALHRSIYEFGIVGDRLEYDETLRNAAPALFAAARERDKLREALEAAEDALATVAIIAGPPAFRAALAKARAALGRDQPSTPTEDTN